MLWTNIQGACCSINYRQQILRAYTRHAVKYKLQANTGVNSRVLAPVLVNNTRAESYPYEYLGFNALYTLVRIHTKFIKQFSTSVLMQ